MNPELIKEAYEYGAALALQEHCGYGARQARVGAVKLAMEKLAEGEEYVEEEVPGRSALSRIGGGLGGAGLGALGLGTLAAGSAFVPGLKGLGATQALSRSGLKFPVRAVPAGANPRAYEALLRGTAGAGIGAVGGGILGATGE